MAIECVSIKFWLDLGCFFSWQRYRVKGSNGKIFFLSEGTVKAMKELVSAKQQQMQSLGAKVSLENVDENILDLKREQAQIKSKLAAMEDNINTILEIMVSRNPVVERV